MTGLTLWRNARIAPCDGSGATLERGALVTDGGTIAWIGAEPELPAPLRSAVAAELDVGRAWITPGLIDCHTHLVFAGTRADEFAERLRGVSYETIAQRGGGILSTVRATRAATEQQLLEQSACRLEQLLAEGVTTVEIKSGYGLTLEHEARMLRVARALGRQYPVTIRTTLLAAHALPPEFAGRPDAYVDTIANDWLPRLHAERLVDAVDVYCERIGFDVAQAERLYAAARALGLPVKMHAEQLANIGGTRLASRYGALSCDHLEYTSDEDVAAMAAAGVTAVLLPVAFYCLGETRRPPVAALRRAGVPLALATDCNPGTAPSASLLLAMNMACRQFGLTAEEALLAVTRNAARALGLGVERGSLVARAAADFVIWSIESPAELAYWTGFRPPCRIVQAGRLATGAPLPQRRGAV